MNEHLSLNKSVGIFMVVFKHRACFSFFSRNDYTRFIPLKTRGGVLITSPGGLYCFQNDSQPQRDKDIIGITFGKRFTRCA